jgi:hypothetical protein
VSDPGVASGFLLFCSLFLIMWTAGGMAVSTHLFRNVAGEDLVWLTSEFLVIHRRAGLLRRITRVPRHDIRRIGMTDRHISTPYGDRKKIASAVDEPCELYWLAKWLAAHTHFYLDTGNSAPRVNPPTDIR